ncbi:MAG: tyrosine--tRNA ligase [Candidatus Staskawiczbacteria bacterium]|nr:tyrosine--tRNA ligase [Candidatus Staskawiczbacteria bacterium]
MTDTNSQKIEEILKRGSSEVIVEEHLKERLASGEKLRIKFGIDPTGNLLHLGHAVCLMKLREFQEAGHQVIFLIGDFTARIGDPTGRTNARAPLGEKQIKENMRDYVKQAALILNMKKVEIRYNSQWWNKMDLREMMQLAMKVTYSQVSAREDFKKRLAEDKDFTLEEFLYPVLQGYDSVALKADVEIGGTDQKFNMLMGRQIQKRYNQNSQDVITIPILEGLDGKEKMSKSLRNFIAIIDKPHEMYGKIMSLPDFLTLRYFELCTRISMQELADIKDKLANGNNPRDIKARLAKEIVKMYHGDKKAAEAEEEFNKVFRDKELPSDILVFQISKNNYLISDLLFDAKMVASKKEAKRLVEGGGVQIEIPNPNDQTPKRIKIQNWREEIKLEDGMIIKVGSRKFIKIKNK